MEIFVYVFLAFFWVTFGSFSSVIIDRLRHGKSGIIAWRSECPQCKHLLWGKDLVPILSYLSTGWKCRYCHAPIGKKYPLLELAMAGVFVGSAYAFVDIWNLLLWSGEEIIKLFFFLLFGFFSFIYVVYDLMYLEIPESILAILVGLLTLALFGTQMWYHILPTYHEIWQWTFFEQGILWTYYAIVIAWLYAIMTQEYEIYQDFFILIVLAVLWWILQYFLYINLEQSPVGSALLAVGAVFGFFFLLIALSWGKWMGWWDLRIAIVLGLLVGIGYTFPAMFITYLSGSIIGILIIIWDKYFASKKQQPGMIDGFKKSLQDEEIETSWQTPIPFWPFLCIGMYSVLIFQNQIDFLLKMYF